MKSVHLFATAFRVFAVAAMLLTSACNHPLFDWEEPGGGGGKPGHPVVTDCKVRGKVVRVMCGTSIYDNFWIQTPDGKYYRPCEQSFQTLCPIGLKEGDHVMFSYRKLPNCKSCDDKITCLAALPPFTNVVIDCIQVLPQTDCEALVLDRNVSSENNYLHVINAAVEGRFLKLKIGYSGCNVLPKSAFRLSWTGAFAKSLPPQADLFVNINGVTPTVCQAYFTTDLCFDVSSLKSSSSQPVQINIGGHQILF